MSHCFRIAALVPVTALAIGGCGELGMQPLKTVRVSEGVAGNFTIGETKEQILSWLTNEMFSPQPKPMACPVNWLNVSTLTKTERTCLLTTDTWEEGVSSTRASCPERVDVNTVLRFSNDRLSEVVTECWEPQ